MIGKTKIFIISYYQIRIENKVGKKVTPSTQSVRNWFNQNSNYAI